MANPDVQLIAVTGGIGSGKSRVCNDLAMLCRRPLLDLDMICRDLLDVEAPGWQALKKNIDSCFFAIAGELDRPAFRRAIFKDKLLRRQVDGLLHPLARAEMNDRAAQLRGPVFVEIPLLFEAGWHRDVDRIVVVYAEQAVRLKRIIRRDRVSEGQARREIQAQACLARKALLAHHLIENSCSWQTTSLQLRHLSKAQEWR